jgi:nucleoid-associated protein YgaU
MARIKTLIFVVALLLMALLGTGNAALAHDTQSPSAYPPGTYHRILPGETLSSIAYWTYGNAGLWGCIWNANSWLTANPNYVQAGWTIYLPTSCSGYGNTGGSYPPAGTYYRVQRGDTLSGIACRYYWNCNYWPIVNANPVLHGNANYVQAGWVLYIP